MRARAATLAPARLSGDFIQGSVLYQGSVL
jgi:hypothetical protein